MKVIAHIDLDAFYAQVEVKQHPQLRGKPVVVAQYNPYATVKNLSHGQNRIMNNITHNSIIAVSYEAREFGVKRSMKCREVRELCKDLQIVQVPTAHGKADISLYRMEGKKVVDILSAGGKCERASIDESYLDLTEEAQSNLSQHQGQLPNNIPNAHRTHVCGQDSVQSWLQSGDFDEFEQYEKLLAWGAHIVAQLRQKVYDQLGYTCSAGIAHTKVVAKLCSGLNKPNQQTIVPLASVQGLLDPLPIKKLQSLGGKLGQQIASAFNIQTVSELRSVPYNKISKLLGDEDAQWLTQLIQGQDNKEVQSRTLPKSISCGKAFRGTMALNSVSKVQEWLCQLSEELCDRLQEQEEEHRRKAKLLTLNFVVDQGSISRSCSLTKVDPTTISQSALQLIKGWFQNQQKISVQSMFLVAGNFEDSCKGQKQICNYFSKLNSSSFKRSISSLENENSIDKNTDQCNSYQLAKKQKLQHGQNEKSVEFGEQFPQQNEQLLEVQEEENYHKQQKAINQNVDKNINGLIFVKEDEDIDLSNIDPNEEEQNEENWQILQQNYLNLRNCNVMSQHKNTTQTQKTQQSQQQEKLHNLFDHKVPNKSQWIKLNNIQKNINIIDSKQSYTMLKKNFLQSLQSSRQQEYLSVDQSTTFQEQSQQCMEENCQQIEENSNELQPDKEYECQIIENRGQKMENKVLSNKICSQKQQLSSASSCIDSFLVNKNQLKNNHKQIENRSKIIGHVSSGLEPLQNNKFLQKQNQNVVENDFLGQVDLNVLNELPLSIQNELKLHLGIKETCQQSKTCTSNNKQQNSMLDYFSKVIRK